jgi:hypothetical protein
MRVIQMVLAAILLLPSRLQSYEPDASRFVVVADPLVRVVPTADHLREWCGVSGNIEACTRFIAFRLETTCVPAADQWAMRATATFRPWIFLRNLAQLTHEHDHIGDVQRSVAGHVAALEGLSFPAAEECRARSLQEATRFGELMRVFARESNETRHAVLRNVHR